MKKLSFILLVLFSISFSSCSDDDSSGGSTDDDELYLKFTYNGQQYNFEPETITSLQRLVAGNQEVNSVFTRLSLWMPVTPILGSHEITDATPTDANLTTLHNAELWVGENIFEGTSGTLVITEFDDDYVKGTFSFSGANFTVTNGSFRAYR